MKSAANHNYTRYNIMMNNSIKQTFLGFDFGTKRIGMAVGQNITQQARALTTIFYVNKEPDWQTIKTHIDTWQPAGLVIGIPYNMDGTEQPITALVKKFCASCSERFALPMYEIDERLTTVEAKAQLFADGGYKTLKKSEVDAYAAKLILESWLQQKK